MTLVDSSVWIDYLAGRQTPWTARLDGWLKGAHAVAITGVVFQEVLQGARDERSFQLLRGRLSSLAFLPATKQTHSNAAALYRRARARGVSVPAADALIAAVAIESGAELLTADQVHFSALTRVSKLKLATVLAH
jgi:hypothetical protein